MNRLVTLSASHPFENYPDPKFVAYCRDLQYISPYHQWAEDNCSNKPFHAWTSRKLKEWRSVSGYLGGMDDKHHAQFDAWLGQA